MDWNPLGAVILTHDWQMLPGLASVGETFRIQQNYSTPPIGRAVIAQVYAYSAFYSVRRIYATQEDQIVTLPIPLQFQSSGIVTRQIALKLSYYTRTLRDWRVSVDIFS